MKSARLVELARRWAEGDVDDRTREWVHERLDGQDFDALREVFEAPLTFGTAGLRGKVGAGPGRMNHATVSLVSWALGRFLLQGAPSTAPQVVIGYDARHDSASFARRAARVLAGLGVDVLLSDVPVPTPLIAFSVRKLGAAAGAVITASHNPRGDNGYKVYDDQGIQIVAPWDREIARFMNRAPAPRAMNLSDDCIALLPNALSDEYTQQVRAVAAPFGGKFVDREQSTDASRAPLSLVYTALHGVGARFFESALGDRSAEVALHFVESQKEPDGDFPTVPFPNPEEPGALDELMSVMGSLGASVGLANDPDADRFCLVLEHQGRLEQLSGDALGLLLADACARCLPLGQTWVSTVVSSPGFQSLAEIRGARAIRTLTGFKWLCRAALSEADFVFAYEEALGYCFRAPSGWVSVLDKDGIATALVAVELALSLGGGSALFGRLLELYRELGYWGSHGRSLRLEGAGAGSEVRRRMHALRTHPPSHLASAQVTTINDYAEAAETRPSYLGSAELLSFELDFPQGAPGSNFQKGRVLIRPSGTEPKLKFYIHLCSAFDESTEYERERELQQREADAIFEALEFHGSDPA